MRIESVAVAQSDFLAASGTYYLIYQKNLIWLLTLTHNNQTLRLTDTTSAIAILHLLFLIRVLASCIFCAIRPCEKHE